MHGRRAEDGAATELRALLAQLERSGLAERRADVRQLLERSRFLLHAGHPVPAAGPPLRAGPSARNLAGKLGTVLNVVLDALVLMAFFWACGSVLTHRGAMLDTAMRPEVALALIAPGWILLRRAAGREALREAGCRLLYHLAWGYDWFAEAFSRRAMRRLSARLAAREVMRAWRRHRHSLLHRPGPDDVEGFLELAYGARAAHEFRCASGRIETLRWSVLIRLFEGIAASGALWPSPASEPAVEPMPVPAPETPPPEAEPPEIAQRRVDLRDLIRKKRQDITTAYGWKLKTEAEIAQRDTYLGQTRKEIGAMEKELAALGG